MSHLPKLECHLYKFSNAVFLLVAIIWRCHWLLRVGSNMKTILSFDQSPFPFNPKKYSIPKIEPSNVHPRINKARSITYGKIAVTKTTLPIDFVPRNTKKYISTHVKANKINSSFLMLPNWSYMLSITAWKFKICTSSIPEVLWRR